MTPTHNDTGVCVEPCPRCQGPMKVRRARGGKYFGCQRQGCSGSLGFEAVRKIQRLRRSLDGVIRQRDEVLERLLRQDDGGGDLSGEVAFRPRQLGVCLAELAKRRAETAPMIAKAVAEGLTKHVECSHKERRNHIS